MNLWLRYCLALATLSLTACANLAPKDENSPFYAVPAGSRIVLHQNLQISPDRARVYLQDGKIVRGPSPFSPYCQFEVNDLLPAGQILKADEFVVRKTQMGEEFIASRSPFILAVSGGGNAGSRDLLLVWHLWLESPRQPNVRRMICGGRFDTPYRARRPSINEIRTQLGDIATLKIMNDK